MSAGVGLFVGDVAIDLTMTVRRLPEPDEKLVVDAASEAPGGVVANAAVACARAGANVRLVIATGDDLAARFVVERLSAAGLSVSVRAAAGLTCRAVSLLEPHGEKRLLLYPGVSMFPGREQIDETALDDVGWVHAAVYDRLAARRLIDRCRCRGIPWSLDLEPTTFPLGIDELAGHIDGASTVFCNVRAALAIGGDVAELLLGMGAACVVLTCGSNGAVLCTAGSRVPVRTPPGEIVDTTGAGDCLAGWFVAERLAGSGPVTALRHAVAAATISCAAAGAQASYPARAAVAAAMAGQAG
jgi:ribokinase